MPEQSPVLLDRLQDSFRIELVSVSIEADLVDGLDVAHPGTIAVVNVPVEKKMLSMIGHVLSMTYLNRWGAISLSSRDKASMSHPIALKI